MTDIDELSPEEIEDLLEYAAEVDAKLRAEQVAELEAEYERLRPVREAARAKRDTEERKESQRRYTLESRARAALTAKGVSLNIAGCGCCGSPTVSVEIDGELIVDSEDNFDIEMIEAAE